MGTPASAATQQQPNQGNPAQAQSIVHQALATPNADARTTNIATLPPGPRADALRTLLSTAAPGNSTPPAPNAGHLQGPPINQRAPARATAPNNMPTSHAAGQSSEEMARLGVPSDVAAQIDAQGARVDAVTQAVRAGIISDIRQIDSALDQLDQMPPGPEAPPAATAPGAPQFKPSNPQQIFGQVAPVLLMLLGAGVRGNIGGALQAGTAMMTAQRENNLQAYALARQQWTDQLNVIHANSEYAHQRFTDIMAARNQSREEILARVSGLQAELQSQTLLMGIESGSLDHIRAWGLGLANVNQRLVTAQARLQQQEQRMHLMNQREVDRRAAQYMQLPSVKAYQESRRWVRNIDAARTVLEHPENVRQPSRVGDTLHIDGTPHGDFTAQIDPGSGRLVWMGYNQRVLGVVASVDLLDSYIKLVTGQALRAYSVHAIEQGQSVNDWRQILQTRLLGQGTLLSQDQIRQVLTNTDNIVQEINAGRQQARDDTARSLQQLLQEGIINDVGEVFRDDEANHQYDLVVEAPAPTPQTPYLILPPASQRGLPAAMQEGQRTTFTSEGQPHVAIAVRQGNSLAWSVAQAQPSASGQLIWLPWEVLDSEPSQERVAIAAAEGGAETAAENVQQQTEPLHTDTQGTP